LGAEGVGLLAVVEDLLDLLLKGQRRAVQVHTLTGQVDHLCGRFWMGALGIFHKVLGQFYQSRAGL
jgi:hypothetical protein